MFGVSPIEMIVEIALSLLAVMCNFHNHFCPAELLLNNCKKECFDCKGRKLGEIKTMLQQ